MAHYKSNNPKRSDGNHGARPNRFGQGGTVLRIEKPTTDRVNPRRDRLKRSIRLFL